VTGGFRATPDRRAERLPSRTRPEQTARAGWALAAPARLCGVLVVEAAAHPVTTPAGGHDMSIPMRLSGYLEQRGARYDLCLHAHSRTSAETARTAHVPPHAVAKSVILEDDDGCVLAVVPADRRVRVGEVARLLGRHALRLSDERRIRTLFDDCDPGAVPAFGMAWGIETIVDDELDRIAEVYVEAGDHEQLLHMTQEQFHALMSSAQHGHFCQPAQH
jgi:Ala-tRNA(Pro) deacylase